MIQYTANAQRARAHLLQKYNDVLIFVEDETCQNMHVRFFAKLLEGFGKVQHVFPLHGREAVLNAALSDTSGDPRIVYIIDGDLDALTERAIPQCQNLYRLNAYCMENLLISESALLSIAAESAVDKDDLTLRRELAFASHKEWIERLFGPLFHHYALVCKLNLPVQTVSFAVVRLCGGDAPHVDTRLVRNRTSHVRKQIIAAIGWPEYKSQIRRVRTVASQLRDRSAAISGKDYLIPMIHRWLGKKLNFRDSRAALAVRLALLASPEVEPPLRDFVRSAALAGYELQA